MKRILALICVTVVALGVLLAPGAAFGWSAYMLPAPAGAFGIDRGDTTGTLTVYVYSRGSTPTSAQYQDGSYDTTTGAVTWSLRQVVKMDADGGTAEALTGVTDGAFLFVGDNAGVSRRCVLKTDVPTVKIGTGSNTVPVSVMSTGSTGYLPVSVVNTPAVVVSSIPSQSVAVTASIPSTLTVTPSTATDQFWRVFSVLVVSLLGLMAMRSLQ